MCICDLGSPHWPAHVDLFTHLDRHPAYSFYWVVSVFDPRQLPCLSHDIADYEDEIKALKEPSQELMDKWLIYTQFQSDTKCIRVAFLLGQHGGNISISFPNSI